MCERWIAGLFLPVAVLPMPATIHSLQFLSPIAQSVSAVLYCMGRVHNILHSTYHDPGLIKRVHLKEPFLYCSH